MDSLVAERLINSSPELKSSLEKVCSEIYRLTRNEEEARELFTQALGIGIQRPVTWSATSNAAYYKEKYGKILLRWLAELEKSGPGKDLLLNSKMLRKSRESLVIQISQSWMWLINNAKTEEEAHRLMELKGKILVKRVLEGVMLVWKKEINPDEIVSKLVNSQIKQAEAWKSELLEFVNTAEDGKLLHIENTRLEPYDIAWIKAFVEGTKGLFLKKLGTTSFQVVKHLELWKKVNQSS
jgi:hypothetical protein